MVGSRMRQRSRTSLLELTEGRVVEAIAWPPGESGEGSDFQRWGRARRGAGG